MQIMGKQRAWISLRNSQTNLTCIKPLQHDIGDGQSVSKVVSMISTQESLRTHIHFR